MKSLKPLLKNTGDGGILKTKHGKRDSKVMGIREELCERFGYDFLFADGYDGAIIGVCVGHDSGRVVYSVEKMIEACMKEAGMTHEDSIEWLEFNTFGAYVGSKTPIYMDSINDNFTPI